MPTSGEMHRLCHAYLIGNGWHREEPGSGWYIHPDWGDARIGEAVSAQLERDGVDAREDPADAD